MRLRIAAWALIGLACASVVGGVIAGVALVRYSPYSGRAMLPGLPCTSFGPCPSEFIAATHPYAPIGWIVLAGGFGVAAVLAAVAIAVHAAAHLADALAERT